MLLPLQLRRSRQEVPTTLFLGGKPSRQRVIAATSFGIPSTSRILFIVDKQSQRHFMTDTGSDVSAIPPTPAQCQHPNPSRTLRAVNHSSIKTYGCSSLYSHSVYANVPHLFFSVSDVPNPPWALISFAISTCTPISVTPAWLIIKPNSGSLFFRQWWKDMQQLVATCSCTRATNRSSRLGYRSILVLTS